MICWRPHNKRRAQNVEWEGTGRSYQGWAGSGQAGKSNTATSFPRLIIIRLLQRRLRLLFTTRRIAPPPPVLESTLLPIPSSCDLRTQHGVILHSQPGCDAGDPCPLITSQRHIAHEARQGSHLVSDLPVRLFGGSSDDRDQASAVRRLSVDVCSLLCLSPRSSCCLLLPARAQGYCFF